MMTALSVGNYSLEEMDKQCLLHPLTSVADHLKGGPLIVSDGHGVRVKDRNGRPGIAEAVGRGHP
jgi:L-2,4-diaminobutyrate transaminase